MNYKHLVIYTVVLVVATAAGTRYLFPSIQERIKIQEKEVIKKDIVTVIKERTKPDGTKEKETTITDRTKENKTKEVERLVTRQKDWHVSISANTKPNFKLEPVYGLQVNRRILGPVFLGASASTDKTVGVVLGIEF